MATESAIFTVLPNGVHESGDFLQLTVFVSPRLSTDGAGALPLAGGGFTAFEDWPSALQDMRFAVVFDGVGPIGADPDPVWASADSATWQLLFDGCSVKDGKFTDLSKRRFLSLPVRTVSQSVLNLYTRIAEEFPAAFPAVTTRLLRSLGRSLGHLSQYKEEIYPSLDALIAQQTSPNGKTGRYLDRGRILQGDRERMGFAEAYRFYDRPGARDPLGKDKVPQEPKVPEIDFHGFVAFCGDYPRLLRSLGLAIDLLVKFDPAITPQGRIRVEIQSPSAFEPWMTAEEARPWTRYELADHRFLAEPRFKEADLVDGMLQLESGRLFVVNQFDVDGSALKTVDFAGNLFRLAQDLSPSRSMTEDASPLPALRTGGFTIARDGRAERTVHHLDDATSHEDNHASGTPTELFAEDVTRGYRVDVEESKRVGRWLSLHRRTGTYRVEPQGGPSTPLPIDPDEGYVKGASTTSVPGNDDDLYLHEAMFGWEGWSLAAKRPGQAITNRGAEAINPENPTDFPLFTEFEATPLTLPRLRFGWTYRFRARAVDLAGNSIREDDVVPQHATEPHTFRRFEPVPSPAVIPRQPFTEGESLLRMVIRSTLGFLPPAYVALPRIEGLAGHTDPLLAYLDTNERHLAPPLASQQLAEWHGKFDAAMGPSAGQADLDDQFDLAARESGSFLQTGPAVFVFNPDPATMPTDLSDPSRKKGDPLKPGEYVCHDTGDLALPYLPDPLSLGASFTSLPGDAVTRLQRWEAGPEWYERRPFRIRIEDGSGPPVYESGKRLLRVFLPQAEMVTVRLASFMDPGDLELMAVWMLEQSAVRAGQQAIAEQGRHWMLTPWQPLTLVHAVEKPLQPPVIDVPPVGVLRNVGETFAVLTGRIQNHAKSTGRLDVEASWSEPLDDLADEKPSKSDGRAHVADFQLVSTEDDCRIGRDDAPGGGRKPPVHKVRHEFRDTKHRYVTYRAIATTRFREYFPSKITDDPSLVTHDGPELELNVPSSRRPEPPDVLYVVPTWTWEAQKLPGFSLPGRKGRLALTLLRTRTGGGLRVYLDRPWFSSGVDELLGVVLEDQPWITWPLDLLAGLEVSAVAKALADEFATRVIAEGLVRPGGRVSAPPSERLMAGIRRIGGRAPFRGVAPSGAARGRLSREEQVEAALAVQARAELLAGRAEVGKVARLTNSQLASLEAAMASLFLPSGDPQKYVTHWGLDPIWGSAPVNPGPYIHQFPLRVAVGRGISLLEAPGHTVAVVGHQPRFDESRKLWYCDLQLEAGPAYFPFVKLALARYQPHSIPGQHLSAVVFPDFAQLVAERTAAMTRVGRSAVAVSLRGPAGYTENAEDLVPLLQTGNLEQVLDLSRFAMAQVERLPAGATSDLAWNPVGDEIRLQLSAPGGVANVRYSGTVPIPPRQQGEQLRLALREYEIFETDESEADDHFIRPISATDFVFLDRPVRYRLVYADHLEL
jgi:hypothetical protein